jgi:hypothetical protein
MSVTRLRTTNSKRQGKYTKCTAMPLNSKVALMWMTSIGLLTASILFLSNQHTQIAVEQQVGIGSMEDHAYFVDHFQLPPSLKVDTGTADKETDAESLELSGRRGRPHREKKTRNRKERRDEKASKALVVNDKDDSQQQQREKYRNHWLDDRPPLESMITKKGSLKGDVSPLLDFAILGHAKTATTFIMNWLSVHPEIQIFDEEVCDLNEGRPADLVKKLYQELETGSQYKRGFKCPGHFSRNSFRNFRRYFRHTSIIVGLRHPVRWFESFYNFRSRHPRGKLAFPEPTELLGECTPESQGVCTARAEFHGNLAMMAKTNLTNPDEWKLLRVRDKYRDITLIDNPVFLYDVNQLYDSNTTRKAAFKADLRDFLGVKADMPEPVEEGKSSKPKQQKMDICEPQYAALRTELLEIGERASIWITKYFMAAPSDQVVVSSPDFFKEILQDWKVDPCVVIKEV